MKPQIDVVYILELYKEMDTVHHQYMWKKRDTQEEMVQWSSKINSHPFKMPQKSQ